MQTTTNDDLKTLGYQLETFLREQNCILAVRCAVMGDGLIVVGNHREDAVENPNLVLRSLQQLIQSLKLEFAQRVQVYLRVVGHQKPYVRHQFTLQSPPCPTAADGVIPSNASAPSCQPTLRDTLQEYRRFENLGDTLTLVAGIGAMGLAMGSYTLTRPCVIGSCSELDNAQVLEQASTKLIQNAATRQDLQDAQRYLDGAVGLLDTIPQWSRRSQEAHALSQDYHSRSIAVGKIIAITELASQALEQTKGDRINLEVWESSRLMWMEAIAQLEKVPEAHPLYQFAQNKLTEYREKLEQATQKMLQEQQAQRSLDLAKQGIQMATARQQTAQTPEDQQFIQTTWQEALTHLQEIPQGTLAVIEAQRLLAAYQPAPSEPTSPGN